jgi:uncharacterized RDD family membrane protein YckC
MNSGGMNSAAVRTAQRHEQPGEGVRVNDSQMQPGWYYAQGDPAGTQRYWDGTQWVGGPQLVGQPAGAGAGLVGGAPPADWGQRFIAWLINWALMVGILVVGAVIGVALSAGNEGLGAAVFVLTGLGWVAFGLYEYVYRQGTAGTTIGKSQQRIKLVKDDTGQPPGVGLALGRMLIAYLISSFTCGIYGLLDVLWPLWDVEKTRLTDKILSLSVIRN